MQKNIMAKSLFVFSIQSVSDVITNSSSELFVFQDQYQTVEKVKELLNTIYPEWRTEYEDPKAAKALKTDEISCVIDAIPELRYESRWIDWYEMTPEKFKELKEKELLDEFKLPKVLELKPEEAYSNWDNWYPFFDHTSGKHLGDYYLKLSRKACTRIKKYLTEHNIICMFSLDENPTWEKQEKLMEYATRVHLG